MASKRNLAAPVSAPAPVPEDGRVRVVIRAGHTHAGVRYAVDTPYRATLAERDLLVAFGGLVSG